MKKLLIVFVLYIGAFGSANADTIKYKVGGLEVTKEQTLGKAYYEFVYDDAGHIKTTYCFDEDGKPTLDFKGIHRVDWTTNSKGDTTSTEYFGINGEKVSDKMGIHRKEITYKQNGDIESIKNFDVNGNAAAPKYLPK